MASYVISSGVTSAYTVGDGDTLTVLSGGESHGSTVQAGGMEIVSSGGYARGDVISAGGVDVFHRGGTENDVTVHSGGVLELADAAVTNGAYLNVGRATYTQQFAGVTVDSGGAFWSFDTHVGTSGAEYVSSAGLAIDTTVTNGGELVVYQGGVAAGATIGRGGLLLASGTLAGAIQDKGEVVYKGGTAASFNGSLTGNGVFIDDQARLVTLSGDASGFTGTAELQSGTLALADTGGLGKAKIDFIDGAQTKTLRIGAADTPADGGAYASPLEDFDASNERLDLTDVAYVSGATATVSGSTLTLTDGAYTAAFALSGSKSTAYTVSADAAGDTLIHAKSGASVDALRQAVASFDPPAAAPASMSLADERRGGFGGLAAASPALLHHARA